MGKFKLRLKQSQTATVGRFHNKKINLYMANEARRLMEPYVPASSDLILSRTANVYTNADSEKATITYTQKYAHYQYIGELYISPTTGSSWAKKDETKIPAGRPLNYDKMTHPLATNQWDKAMMRAHGKNLMKSVELYVKRNA